MIDLSQAAFVHPSVLAFGSVTAQEGASLWPHVVIRSEAEHVQIGRYTNVQDFCMIHTSPGFPTIIGDYCSITHHCTIHACKIGNNVLVGINATIYDGCVIGDNSIIGQHAYLKDGTIVPPNSIVVGAPAKIIRTQNSWIANRFNAMLYYRNAQAYARGDHRAWSGPDFERFVQDTMAQLQKDFAELHAAA
jgi:carbonic anhydrase/acetyltransferase-like protein (isoleucine patch superfamily)